ncbi:hypothetical protein [Streptomyces sp. NRRL F-2664]|uniref:hypothetical protein n=1 Tax=Streptomyces sp. NRRL F-2664 TaxID=1463842 RepID=UPI00131E895D|nr:hypothetical protein [Streptomyces sp. NRRL F-2664]
MHAHVRSLGSVMLATLAIAAAGTSSASAQTGAVSESRLDLPQAAAHSDATLVNLKRICEGPGLGAPPGAPWRERLVLAADPQVDGSGEFFLWDLAEQSVTGGFINGDIMRQTVTDWWMVKLRPNIVGVEVRYGDIANPEAARVVGAVYAADSTIT